MKKFFVFLLILLLILGGVGFWGYQKLTEFVHTPVNVTQDQLLTIERGTTGSKLAALLEQEKILDHADLLPWLLKLQPKLNKLKAGTYSLTGVKTLQDLLDMINSGKEAQFSVKFIEGKTFKEWRKNLENAPHLKQTLQGKSDKEIMALLDIPAVAKAVYEWNNMDGWLYPDTYNYTPNSTDLELLKRSTTRLQKALDKAWNERDENLPLADPYQMLILASIVEKETGVAAERPQVASVFINRLKANMKLQTDPTVIYGMGESYTGNIRKKDLETITPYNTYMIEGLPPTPIAMVSESALQAVAHPAKTDFYYFVADGSGGHKFTRNLNEHNKAVQEYLRWYRNQQKGAN
ncbi:endolytic transglycosylase MltG [Haemophilus parainfluenzae]|uniref:Endolytic murein transglycosylase n=1 Tax=Haemophilus parainfluenzae TaxID=729 RepID=A0A377JHK8_HAEPA|nr:endolytic transglycosylase MltG [Haemophilus parainfluenzae]MBS6285300.1 endolytic transglycosylase MltG [Haemophilus parainfluenzae]STP05249.1 aminodeoxychorismate lyase [Haemophilus parainfluenzae]